MSHSRLWLCASCGGQTADPLILQGRRGGWLVATVCRSCRKTNFHNRQANWISEENEVEMIKKATAQQGTIPPSRQGVTDADTDTNRNEPISHP
jgi:hypothetical protein